MYWCPSQRLQIQHYVDKDMLLKHRIIHAKVFFLLFKLVLNIFGIIKLLLLERRSEDNQIISHPISWDIWDNFSCSSWLRDWDMPREDNLGCWSAFVPLSTVIVVFVTWFPDHQHEGGSPGASPIGCYLQHPVPTDSSNRKGQNQSLYQIKPRHPH